MVDSRDLVSAFKSYLSRVYGYDIDSLRTRGENCLHFMNVDFLFNVRDDRDGVLISLLVEGANVSDGLESRMSEIEDGSFWEKYLPEGAARERRKYGRYLEDVRILRQDDGYVFRAKVTAGTLETIFETVFHAFIRPVLYCVR